MALKFLRMRQNHLAECARIFAAVFSSPPWSGKWSVKASAKYLEDCFRTRNFRGIVALEMDEIVGFAFGLVQQWENEQRFHLKEMCVRATQQRSGVGTRMLGRFVSELKAAGVSEITLGTARDTPAARFYARLGFETDPKTIIMSKRLTISRPLRRRRSRKSRS